MALSLLGKILNVSKSDSSTKIADLTQRLIQREAELGGEMFGQQEKGHTRQFFCLDENTWVWHETWKGGAMTTRYSVSSGKVLKSVNDQPYVSLSTNELNNFEKAVRLYHQQVLAKLYPSTQAL